MSSAFPTRRELKYAGISFIISQICWGITIFLFSIDYDIYNIQEQSDVITLHNTLSSSKHRAEIEIAIAFIFISFPFLLISLHGLNKLLTSVFDSTPGEMVVYIVEKAYIIWITISNVILPALCLVAVSFEWSFTEKTTSEDTYVPTGYYIQYYVTLYQLEMIDTTVIADATFMISLFMSPAIIRYGANKGNNKLQRMKQVIQPEMCPSLLFGVLLILVLSFIIIFFIVLFEFGESGFNSPFGYAKYLMIWSFIWKFLLGIRLYILGRSRAYDRVKNVVDGCYEIKSPVIFRENVIKSVVTEQDQEKQQMMIRDDDDDFEDDDDLEDDDDPDEEGEDDDFEAPHFKINVKTKRTQSFMREQDPVTPMAKGPNIRL